MLERVAALSDASRELPLWWHWIAGLDVTGRLTLPVEARQLCDGVGLVRASSHADAVVLRRDDVGAATLVDRRGRVRLPGWLRRQVGATGAVFVAARRPEASTVLVTPASRLDVVADALVQGVG